jgi:hypothetical protein
MVETDESCIYHAKYHRGTIQVISELETYQYSISGRMLNRREC